jgi:glycosyltransferase involved in cell wall biosynthesis
MAGFISRIPFSFTAHAYDIYCTEPRLRNDTLIWKLRHAIQIFAVSDHAASLLKEKLPSACDRIYTVRVGIPLDIFTVEPPLPMNGIVKLLSICYFHDKKGLDTLIDACALLRNQKISFQLRLFGDGPLRAALQAQISRLSLGDHVTLGGPISQDEVSRQMKACHLFVLPCRRDQTGDMDGIPTVFMEAMASGRPVITCPITGIPELVRHGETGLLVQVNDPDAISAAIIRLVRDDSLRARLGYQARALVERNHDQNSNTQCLLALMNRVSQCNGE